MAAGFDGATETLDCAGETAFDWERTTPHSMACWLRAPVLGPGNRAFMAKGDVSLQRGFVFNFRATSGPDVHVHITSTSTNHIEVVGPAAMFQLNFWVHLAYTYDGSSTAAGVLIYRNGVAVTPTTLSDTLTTTILHDQKFSFGGAQTEFFTGDLAGGVTDDVVWTATEVATLAKLANLLKPPSQLLTAAPELWLPISARPGASAFDTKDYSGNAHDATIVGTPTVVADPEVVLDWKADHTGVTDSNLFTTSASVTHAPHVAALSGVVVLIAHGTVSTDHVSSVTYGGVPMTRVGFAQDTAGEAGAVYAYFLGSGVPQGSQTVAVTATGTENKIAWVFGLLAAGDVGAVASDSVQGDAANPSVTLTTPANFSGLVFNVIYSGLAAPTSLTAGSGYTKMQARDFGAFCATVEAGNKEGVNVASGWTSAIDDVAMLALAVGATPRRSRVIRSDALHRASRW